MPRKRATRRQPATAIAEYLAERGHQHDGRRKFKQRLVYHRGHDVFLEDELDAVGVIALELHTRGIDADAALRRGIRAQRGRIVAPDFQDGEDQLATGQFEISDERSPAEIAAVLRRRGFEPVWKDWDQALTSV